MNLLINTFLNFFRNTDNKKENKRVEDVSRKFVDIKLKEMLIKGVKNSEKVNYDPTEKFNDILKNYIKTQTKSKD